VATGGGVQNNSDTNPIVERSIPIELDGSPPEAGDLPTGWLGRAKGGSGAAAVTVFAVCAPGP